MRRFIALRVSADERKRDRNSTVTRAIVIYISLGRGTIGATASHAPKSGHGRRWMHECDEWVRALCARYTRIVEHSRSFARTTAIRNKALRLSGACHYRRMIKSIIDAKHARCHSSDRTSRCRRVLIGIDRRTAVGYVCRELMKNPVWARARSHAQARARADSGARKFQFAARSAMLIISSLYAPYISPLPQRRARLFAVYRSH